jgi:hypothetical protein
MMPKMTFKSRGIATLYTKDVCVGLIERLRSHLLKLPVGVHYNND